MKINLRRGVLFLLLAMCLSFRPSLIAQDAGSVGDSVRPEQNAPANESPKPVDASGEDTAQVKHSGSVRWLSRKTGLSLEGAYWLAVLINFGIVVVAIVWASKMKLPAKFRDRTASIQKSIEEARRASED